MCNYLENGRPCQEEDHENGNGNENDNDNGYNNNSCSNLMSRSQDNS